MLKPALIIIGLAQLIHGLAEAGDLVGSPARGLDFARDHCATCHDVEPEPTPVWFSREIPFYEMAQDALITEMAIRAFLRTPHIEMPNLILSEEDTDDVVAYILSLKR